MMFKTINPFTNEVVGAYETYPQDTVSRILKEVRFNQRKWARDLGERIDFFKNVVKQNIVKNTEEIATLMSREMGKPISQSIAEVNKSVKLIDYLIENGQEIFDNENIKTEARKSYVRFDPLGVVMAIEPWNFPLWQAARAIFPAMIAGNGVVLKHSMTVTGVSLKIEEMINSPVFRSLVIDGPAASSLIGKLDGVAFTGSTPTGAKIAEIAGREMKKVVMELGGSDPFIVLKGASITSSAKAATNGRLQNNGQSCIASKRILVDSDIYDEFVKALDAEFSKVRIGDPLDRKTYLGPLASKAQRDLVQHQIDLLKMSGKMRVIGEGAGNIIPPTIIQTDYNYSEEIFGPVAIVRKFRNTEEAIAMANETPFGLGASIWGDVNEAEKMAPEIEAGMVYINSIVFSDPRLPFGGTKKSGLGRELSKYGSREFTNMKTVWVN